MTAVHPGPVQPRALITGVGTVNPLGSTAVETWSRLVAGESGIA
jgi:3-oxoacyl-[acyl-carrier-protein] synthase II